MNVTNISKFEAPIALFYCALVLVLMEYFFLPIQAERWPSGAAHMLWLEPSLSAGLVWSASCLIGFLVLPVLILKFIFKIQPLTYGFSTFGFAKHLKIYLLLYTLMVPFIYFAFLQPQFATLYPFIPAAKESYRALLIWESAYILQFFCLEFFFRGYLLYTLEKNMPKWTAIAVMVVPYTMIHFHKPFLEACGAIIAGAVLGWLSLRYRTWLGGALLHSLVAVTIDLLSAHSAGLF